MKRIKFGAAILLCAQMSAATLPVAAATTTNPPQGAQQQAFESRAMLRAELNQLPRFKLDLADVDILYPHFVSHPIGIDLMSRAALIGVGSCRRGW